MASLWRLSAVLLALSLAPAFCREDLAEQIRTAQQAGDYQKAAALYPRLIASGEDTPEIRSNYGAMLYLAGRDREAVEQLRTALRQSPGLIAPNLLAGLALTRLGEWNAALPYLQRAHRQQANSPEPLIGLGKAYVGLRDYKHARDAYSQASALDPRSAEAWFGIGITDRSLADAILKTNHGPNAECEQLLHDSLTALTRAAELDPSSPRARLILAESYRDSGKLVDALSEYQAILRISPEDPAASLGLATTYWKSGDVEPAVPYLNSVLSRFPEDAEANGIMANILVHRGAFHEALPYARKALAGNPNLAQVRASLAKIYLEQKRPESAVRELSRIAPVDPDGSYHFLMARALRELGRDAEASAALERFKQLRAASKAGTTAQE
jgi:tetratricopeptide (TPR) repeat protein